MTRVYLDTSAYNRPLDDQAQSKIFLESQAVAIILQMIEAQDIELVSSSVLDYENSRNPYPLKQAAMSRYLQLANFRQEVNDAIRQRAEELEHNGVKALDALHVACAEVANCDFLVTCDKRLVNRCAALSLQVINPVDFVLETSSDGSS